MVFESLCPFCESRASFTARVRRGRLTQAWSIRCPTCGGQLPALTELELRHARGMDQPARARVSLALRGLERPVLLGFEDLRLLADGGRRENERRHARRRGRARVPRPLTTEARDCRAEIRWPVTAADPRARAACDNAYGPTRSR